MLNGQYCILVDDCDKTHAVSLLFHELVLVGPVHIIGVVWGGMVVWASANHQCTVVSVLSWCAVDFESGTSSAWDCGVVWCVGTGESSVWCGAVCCGVMLMQIASVVCCGVIIRHICGVM